MSRSWGPGSALPSSGPQSLHPETSRWPHGYSNKAPRCPGSRVWLRRWRGLCPFHRWGNCDQESKGGPWGRSRPGGPRGSQAPPLEQAPTAHTRQLRGGCRSAGAGDTAVSKADHRAGAAWTHHSIAATGRNHGGRDTLRSCARGPTGR